MGWKEQGEEGVARRHLMCGKNVEGRIWES